MIFGPQFIHISSSSSGGGGTGTAVSYDSFAIPSGTNNTAWYVVEFNSKLYSYGLTDSEVHESSDVGATWSFKYHMQYNLNAGIIPVVESNRVLYIDGGGSNNVLKSWDGSSSTGTTINTGLTSGQISYFGKVDGYYYYSNFGGPLYRTSDTTLTSGWSQVTGPTTAKEILESGGTIVTVDPTYGIRRTADDWSTYQSPSISVGAPWSIATDGNGNWITGSQGTSVYSTDDGVTWATNYQMHSTESGTAYWNNNFIPPNGIKFIGDKFFWINPWDDELVSNANPFQSHYNNGNFTNTNSRVYQFPGEINYMSLVGNDKMFISGQDANGNYGLYKFNITGLPYVPGQSQTVTPASSGSFFAMQSNNVRFQSNEHTTPAESKRLWNLGNNQVQVSYQWYIDTANIEAGTKLYVSSSLTNLAMGSSGWPVETRNTYGYYLINSNASNQYGSNPASVDYWVKVDTATSTILHVYKDADVTANTLKDLTSNVGSGGTVGTNGAIFFGDGNTGYSTYQGALGANISNQDYAYQIYTDAEDKYPKPKDRTYLTTNATSSLIWGGGAGKWYPFLLEGTTSSNIVSYAIQFDYASHDGSNIATTSPGSSNSIFITDIKDSNGNSITEIPSNATPASPAVPMGWFANAYDEYSAFSTRSNACSGGFANSTSIRVHFKTGTGTIAYPTTTQDIIDGSLSGSGSALDMYTDSNGSPATKFRGGALYVGLVYKPISNQNTSTQPQLTLTALGSSGDVPPYAAEGAYDYVQSCP